MAFLNTSLWLPDFVRQGLVSAPLVWGKLPSRGDYIRHNLKHDQTECLQDWIRAQLRVAKMMDIKETQQDLLQSVMTVPDKRKSRKRDAQSGFWHSLTPSSLISAQTTSESPQVLPVSATVITMTTTGQSALPWCFVLPPNTLQFAQSQYVIGVWMDSSDKVGRRYPLVMIQTASARWIKQYFSNHIAQPREWLHFAARCMAQAVYAEESAQDRPQQSTSDHAATLVSQLTRLWNLYQPGWRETLGRGSPSVDSQLAQSIVCTAQPEDVVRTLDGVRYLPWADWPQRLTGNMSTTSPQPAFWQQDLQGRFVAAGQSLWANSSAVQTQCLE